MMEEDIIDLDSSLLSLQGNVPVVEGNMYDVIDKDEEEESIDGSQSPPPLEGELEGCDSRVGFIKEHKRRKSVCHLRLMKADAAADATPGTSNDTRTEYWKPKLLRKTHKIKLQVPIQLLQHI